jgi:hypothetical protein
MLLKVYSGIELSNDVIVPILLESQNISQVFHRASCNGSIKDEIMLSVTPTFYKNKIFVQIGVHIKMHIKL